MTQSSTPLWLSLRTDYIDDNFDKLVEYVRNQDDKTDNFYKQTLSLLEKRVEELIDSESKKRIYEEAGSREDSLFNVKLLAVYLLTIDKANSNYFEALVALMVELMHITPRRSQELLSKISECLKHKSIRELGFGWYDYDNYIGEEIFAVNICQNMKFEEPLAHRQYVNRGTLMVTNNNIFISNHNLAETRRLATSPTTSVETDTGFTVITKAADRLKAAHETSILNIEAFARDFVREQEKCEAPLPEGAPLKHYSVGDEAFIKIVTKLDDGLHVVTVDPNYQPLTGVISFEHDNILYYRASDIYNYVKVGDVIKATVVNTMPGDFGIENQFIDFIMSEFAANIGYGDTSARFIKETSKSYIWISEDGYPMYTRKDRDYGRDDVVLLRVVNFYDPDDKRYGKIETEIVERLDEEIDTREAQRNCFRDFVSSFAVPDNESATSSVQDTLSASLVNLMARCLFNYQKGMLKPSQRYKVLVQALFLATMTGDDDTAAYIDFAKNYLRALVTFAGGGEINELVTKSDDKFASAESTLQRIAIVNLLREYGNREASQLLDATIASDNITLSRIAQLIQSSNRMQGVLSPAALNVIKHEIIKLLSIENERETDLEADSGAYIGIESATMEFKTSVVMVPGETDSANPIQQGKNVMRGVCAFLNSSTGGNLYIGVNDQGYVSGIENDMKYLKCNTIDSYTRYIQDKLIIPYLGMDAATHVKVEPLHENRVVVLHVEPHPYQVVELENEAYIRVNNESRVMDETTKHDLMAQKLSKQKDKAANVSLLQRAQQLQRCVILHRYASSHSGKVADRHVEPYDIKVQDNLLMAYDNDRRDNRVFNLNRIGHVEILDESWGNKALHQDIEVDSFHLSGSKPISVELKLDMLARNQLIEEFPRTSKHITPDKNDDNVWYYNDEVRNIVGVARFYMGLADHIEIINAPELVDYVKELLKRFPI